MKHDVDQLISIKWDLQWLQAMKKLRLLWRLYSMMRINSICMILNCSTNQFKGALDGCENNFLEWIFGGRNLYGTTQGFHYSLKRKESR